MATTKGSVSMDLSKEKGYFWPSDYLKEHIDDLVEKGWNRTILNRYKEKERKMQLSTVMGFARMLNHIKWKDLVESDTEPNAK
jgi:hypothetical protein